MSKTKIAIVLSLLFLVFVAVFVILRSGERAQKITEQDFSKNKLYEKSVLDTERSSDTMPSLIPKDLPVEPGAVKIQNADSSPRDGAPFSKLVYVTKLNRDVVFENYKQYFKKSGWTLGSEIKSSDSMTLSGNRSGAVLTFSVYENKVEGRGEVSVVISSVK
jgi:hypothetical protein